MRPWFAIFLCTFLSHKIGLAAVDIGIGYTSVTSGLSVPSLSVQAPLGNYRLGFTSLGYQSTYDDLAAYAAAIGVEDKLGEVVGQDLEIGAAFGLYTIMRSYRPTAGADSEKSNDFGFGPQFSVAWILADRIVLRSSILLGVGHVNNAALFFQDFSQTSVGWRW